MPNQHARMTEPHRFGMIALCGAPNVGKSTLLNRIIGRKISIMSPRPQTTRHRILGIKTLPAAQLVFMDTPGLHRTLRKGLNRAIHRTALNSIADADLILFMIDHRGWTEETQTLFAPLAAHPKPVMLLINKMDRLADRAQLLPLMERAARAHAFAEIIPLCARSPRNLNSLLQVLVAALPPGAPGFPPEQTTDRSQRFFAAELVREQTYRLLGRELPYAIAVEVTEFRQRAPQQLHIAVLIWVEKSGQKAILIGRGGRQLKLIAQHARKQMERAFAMRVYLEVWVKVRKGWADNAAMLHALGYAES